mmetsp:Transcript_21144/g.46052  ORF Transcript_21144/g.46052 Transcript_21144/m.46052 type:complete len:308 (+) Transcript_21144:2-925(+)
MGSVGPRVHEEEILVGECALMLAEDALVLELVDEAARRHSVAGLGQGRHTGPPELLEDVRRSPCPFLLGDPALEDLLGSGRAQRVATPELEAGELQLRVTVLGGLEGDCAIYPTGVKVSLRHLQEATVFQRVLPVPALGVVTTRLDATQELETQLQADGLGPHHHRHFLGVEDEGWILGARILVQKRLVRRGVVRRALLGLGALRAAQGLLDLLHELLLLWHLLAHVDLDAVLEPYPRVNDAFNEGMHDGGGPHADEEGLCEPFGVVPCEEQGHHDEADEDPDAQNPHEACATVGADFPKFVLGFRH